MSDTTNLPPAPVASTVESSETPTLSKFYHNQLTRSSVRTPKLAVKGGNFAKVVRVLSGSMVVATVMLGRYPYRITVKLDGVDADRVRDEDGEDADSVKARDQLAFWFTTSSYIWMLNVLICVVTTWPFFTSWTARVRTLTSRSMTSWSRMVLPASLPPIPDVRLRMVMATNHLNNK